MAPGLSTGLADMDGRLKLLEALTTQRPVIDRFNVTHHAASQYLSAWQPTKFDGETIVGSGQWNGSRTVSGDTTNKGGHSHSVGAVGGHSHGIGGSTGSADGHSHSLPGSTKSGGGHGHSLSAVGGHTHWFSRTITGLLSGFNYKTVRYPSWKALTSANGWVPWYSIQAHGSLTDTLKLNFLYAGSDRHQVEIMVTKETARPLPWNGQRPSYSHPWHLIRKGERSRVHSFELEWQHTLPGEPLSPSSAMWFVIWTKTSNTDDRGEPVSGQWNRDGAMIAPPELAMGLRRGRTNMQYLSDDGKHSGNTGNAANWAFSTYYLNRSPT
ncbi:hypothetical protein ABZV77_11610 [Streptomyces sp. NPDC004732]|uniref:hypothetical protein n=1 Tax=Streptomyces sp. NPDC004732 TaxID=3154290 RepID=UPI0033B2935F